VDVLLPKMNGPELSRGITKLHPEAKILFMSGYTDHAIIHQGLLGSRIRVSPEALHRRGPPPWDSRAARRWIARGRLIAVTRRRGGTETLRLPGATPTEPVITEIITLLKIQRRAS